MRDLITLFLHLMVTVARPAGPGGAPDLTSDIDSGAKFRARMQNLLPQGMDLKNNLAGLVA
jgi:hypothetical protein